MRAMIIGAMLLISMGAMSQQVTYKYAYATYHVDGDKSTTSSNFELRIDYGDTTWGVKKNGSWEDYGAFRRSSGSRSTTESWKIVTSDKIHRTARLTKGGSGSFTVYLKGGKIVYHN